MQTKSFWLRVALGRVFSLGPTFVLLSWLTSVAATTAYAQSSTASINGTVRDATGGVVPGATVTLRNVQTNVERKTPTNDVGSYVFLNIIPGEYTLEGSKQGFKTSKKPGFTLVVNQTATHDFTLEVGEVGQEVTVEAVGAEVQSSTAELGAVVAHQQVSNLPLNGRNFTQLLTLTAGVSPVSVSQNNGGWGAVTTGASFTFPSINGQNNRSNFFMLDGINNQGTFLSTYAVPPIIDAIQEFKVQSHNDEAEFGGALGGIINVVSKSGTNDLHGSVWEYLRNDAFDARNTFFQSKTPFRQNQYGLVVGGPVILPKIYNGRNKTFFFAGWQGFRYRRPANTFFRVPTEANLRGDLSDIPQQIFNPFTTREDPNNPGTFIRDPFPNNQIPAELINPGMVRFAQETLPKPVFTGNADRNGLDSTPFQQNQEEYTFRVDQVIGEKDSLWFRYSGLNRTNEGSGGRQSILSKVEDPARNWAVSWVHTFSPSTVLQTQFGHVHTSDNSSTRFRNLSPGFAKEVGFADAFYSGFSGGVSLIPSMAVNDFFSGGETNELYTDFTNVYQYKADASKIVGSHTLKWGGEIDSNGLDALTQDLSSGFSSVQTNDPRNPGGTGSSLASFLLNIPDNATRRNFGGSLRWGGVLSFYFHDQWKATPKLTVNLGLRYDRTFIPPYGGNGSEGTNGGIETGDYDLNRGVYILQKVPPTCAERGHAPCLPDPNGKLPEHVEVDPRGKIYHDTTKNFQPRVGLAYRLSPSTALRASFGVFFDNWAAVTQTAQNYTGNWPDVAQQLAQNLNNPSPSSPTPTVTGTNPLLGSFFPAPTPFKSVAWFMDPYFKNPYSMQWNFGVQRELNASTVVTANYVGSGTKRLQIGGFYNVALTPGPGDQAPRRPFPYIAPTFFDRSWGRSNYHALQFTLDKKYTRGFAYLVSYTWSKSIDIGCSGWYGVEGCSVQDPYHFNNDRSVSGFDLTHLLSVSWVYQLPVGPGKRFSTASRVLNHIVGNWQVNGIATFHSGLPYDLGVSGDIANTGNVGCCPYGFGPYMRLNLVGDPKLSSPTPQQWFNRSAFAVPASFTFGNSGRNILRGDGTQNYDLSIFRQFPLSESKRVEFRGEMFNAFNSPEYAIPERNFSSPNFGRVLGTANQARQVQFGLKIIF